MKHKYIGQQETKDCAVACLYNIITHYDGYISIDKLKSMLKTDKDGTTIYNVVDTAKKLGLESCAYRCELNDLCALNLPIIAHIKIDGLYDHFVIIDSFVDDEILIYDPIRGYIKYNMEDFCKEWTNIIITFNKTKTLVSEKEETIFNNIFKFIHNNSKIIAVVLFISITFTLLSIINSLYLSYLYDNPNAVYKIFILFTFISAFKLILNYFKNNQILEYIKSFDEDIMYKTYDKLLSLPLLYHHTRPIGDIIARINDISVIKEFLNAISFSFIIDVIYILMISLILFIINKVIFILLLIMSIIYISIYLIYRKSIISEMVELKKFSSISNTHLLDSLVGIDTIKNLNLEQKFLNKIKEKYNNLSNCNLKLNRMLSNFDAILDFISDISTIVIIFMGIIFYEKNIISLSNVIAFNTLVVYFFISIKNLISLDKIIIDSKESYKRLVQLHKNTKINTNFETKLKQIRTIKFQKLCYSYDSQRNLINNVSFQIKNKEYTFIKGKSGIGKSTIFKLLMKILNCENNMIKINNIDINEISKEEIVNNICYVSQNEYIFTDTILNNIKLYEDADDNEVNKVIKVTKIDEILENRNITLDYLLEENGHNLSGGERQKIILARSLLKKKNILILDETLNELDVQTEREILKNIKKEYKNSLVLISHRDTNKDLFNKIVEI